MLRPHVVILGAGFSGVYTAKKLLSHVKSGEIDLTIVNRTNYFLFTPLLHEVATGSLTPGSVAEPLREIFAGTDVMVCKGIVESINTRDRRISVSGATLDYDYAVIATGAESNYYGIPGAEKFSYPLKNLADASRIRERIINVFEQAIYERDPAVRLRQLSFAVIGGGATGVEMAAEMADFINQMVRRYYQKTNHCHPEETKITLIHAGHELLEQFSPKLRQAAKEKLERSGVMVQLGLAVTSVSQGGLTLSNHTTIPASTIIWAAGVKPIIPNFKDVTPSVEGGRILVDEFFAIRDNDRIFALGDVAYYADLGSQGKNKPLPMLAQVAVNQSDTVARNIIASIRGKKLRTFRYHSKGSLVSVGEWFAIGEIFSLHIAGRFTWWLWRTVYLFKFGSWKKRVRIAFEWTLNLFYPRDITS